MQKKVYDYVEKWNMILPGEKVVVGVSGGADSVCLFSMLLELKKQLPFEMVVVHVNHGIRGRAAERDEKYVQELCAREGICCEFVYADVPHLAKEWKCSEEETGRKVRRTAFEQTREKYGADKIALAHHQDDNAETFFLHAARGSRITGLGGIRPVQGRYIRPLLCLTRNEIEAYLQKKGLTFCVDETNFENTYMRNKIRNQVIPFFSSQVNAQTVAHINQTMEQLREIEQYLEKQRDFEAKKCVVQEDGGWTLRKDAWEKAEPLIREMVIHSLLCEAAGQKKDIAGCHVEAVSQLMEKQVGRKVDLPYHLTAVRVYEGIRIAREERKTVQENAEVPCMELLAFGETFSGEKRMQAGDIEVVMRVFPKTDALPPPPKKRYTKWFDYDIIKDGIVLRTRRPKDRIVVDREGAGQKLKSFFINEKIPAEERGRIPVIAENGQVLWIVGYRQSKAYQVTDKTTVILEITIYMRRNERW